MEHLEFKYQKIARTIDKMSAMIGKLRTEIDFFQQSQNVSIDCYRPRISMSDSNLLFNEYVIPLSTRPMTLKLVRCFVDLGLKPLSREEIMTHLYRSIGGKNYSPRLDLCHYQNMIKLMSRSRQLFRDAMNTEDKDLWIEFFVYDDAIKKWHFYQLATDRVIH